jgi:hypothetical protein
MFSFLVSKAFLNFSLVEIQVLNTDMNLHFLLFSQRFLTGAT